MEFDRGFAYVRICCLPLTTQDVASFEGVATMWLQGQAYVTFLVFLSAFFCLSTYSNAGSFRDPMIPDGQALSYRYTSKSYSPLFLGEIKQGEEVEESSTVITTLVDEQGKKTYQIVDRGRRKNGYRLEHISHLAVEQEGLKPVSFSARDLNPQGRTIRHMQAVFDDPAVRYPEDTFPVFCIVQAMRGTLFEEAQQVTLTLWIAPTELFRLVLFIRDTVQTSVPAGTFTCYLVEMRPDIRSILPMSPLLARLVQPFVPEYRFWFSVEPSHPLVRFEGALGGAGAVKHTIELTKIAVEGTHTEYPTHMKEAGDG